MFVMFFIRHKDTDLNNSEIHRFRQLTNKIKGLIIDSWPIDLLPQQNPVKAAPVKNT